ncbi:MAG TPA: hypothetical protein PKH94_08355 [Bacteroidales bacterium]|nr:hypothetical protein [Bacteroidales bacterium]HNS47234.1 hypothetical protein [Bacteroidales bacterium]
MVGASYALPDDPDAERWLPALDWIEARMNAIDLIVGGHGAILSIYDLQSFHEGVRKKYNELP